MDTTPNFAPGADSPLGSYGSTTLASLVENAQRRLEGALAWEIWSRAELEGFAQLAYEQFCALTRALWDSRHIPERHEPVYTPDKFSREDAPASSRTWQAYSPPPGPAGRRNVASYVENLVLVSDPAPFLGDGREFARQAGEYALVTSGADVPNAGDLAVNPDSVLPADVLEVTRATYDGRRLQPLTGREADRIDSQWERYTGYPSGYTVRQDGARKLLKRFRGPAAPADTRGYTQETGILRGGVTTPDAVYETVLAPTRITLTPFALQAGGVALGRISTFFPYPMAPLTLVQLPTRRPVAGWAGLTETATYEVRGGPYGFARRISGTYFTDGPFGLPRRWNPGENNTRVDYVKKAPKLATSALRSTRLEVQDWDARHLLWFVLARAYAKDCPGQNIKAAEHYQQRWELGVSMVRARHGDVREGISHVMGRSSTVDSRDVNPTARLPWQYGDRS